MAAVLACGEGAALSHQTAPAVWELRRVGSGVLHVTVPGDGGRKRRTGICVHRCVTLTAPVKVVVVKRRVSCRDWKVVKRFKPRSDGTFTVKLPPPRSGFAAAYRMSTRVKRFSYRTKTYPTFTLPRYVDLG